jgi:thiamine-phosphate pyrophosphorylase
VKFTTNLLTVFRVLDANCNRVREGLRVAEDVARFILNDAHLLKQLKKIRHEVTASEKLLFKSPKLRGLARDVEKDLGRGTQIQKEKIRKSSREILVANLKRAQEGLRSLEEFSKLIRHPASGRFKRMRYECYRIGEDWI